MGRLRTKAANCQYKEYNRLLTEQFINGLNDEWMVYEKLKEVAILEDTKDATCECVLLWACRVEAQRVQKSSLNEIKEAKDLTQLNEIC